MGQRKASLIERTTKSLIIEEFIWGQRVVILIQRTSKSLIIEEFTGSSDSDFDTAHKRELHY